MILHTCDNSYQIKLINSFTFSFWNRLPIPTPSLLVLTPDAAKVMSFALWKLGKEVGLLIYPLPSCLFMNITEKKSDYLNKFADEFAKTVDNRAGIAMSTCESHILIISKYHT